MNPPVEAWPLRGSSGGPNVGAWADVALVAVLGALHSLVFVHTWAWPLQILIVAGLASRVMSASTGRAAALGFAFGTTWVGVGTWWLYVSMHRYGGLPAWLTVLAITALAAFLALYLAAAMATFARHGAGRPWRRALLFGALWMLAELARGVIFTGFPWLASGYAHIDGPLGGYAPWVGVYGIGAIAAALGCWIAAVLRDVASDEVRDGVVPHAPLGRSVPATTRSRAFGRIVIGTAAVLLLGHVAGLASFTASAGPLSVTLLQGNVPQEEKFEAEHVPDSLEWTANALRHARGELVLAPETVIPMLPSQLDPVYWHDLLAGFRHGDRSAIIGAPLGNEEAGYTNSALGLSAESARLQEGFYRYDKHHLVPFGEFIPVGFKWFTRLMNIPLGDFNRGPLGAPSFAVGAQRLAPNICYEDLFGEELATRFADPARAPTIFANISNIGWFGKTEAVEQHLQISRMRTLEFQLPMLRATNTGATVVIDHHAAVTAALAPFTQGVLETSVEGRRGVTPFAWWAARAGLWPLWLLAAALVLVLRARARP